MSDTLYLARAIEKCIHVPRIFSVHHLELNKTFDEIAEKHDFWELAYAENGKIYLHSDTRTYYLNKGDIYITKPNESHYFTGDQVCGSNIFIISFECKSIHMSFFEDKIIRIGNESSKLLSMISAEAHKTFENTLNNPSMRSLEKKSDSPFGGEQIIGNLLENLLITLIREKSSINVRPFLSKDVYSDNLIKSIMQYLDANLYGRIELGELAKSLSYSTTYLSQYFSKVTHYSIVEYYNMMKINEAKRYMRDTKLSLDAISQKLGFCNQHYFSKVFKKYHGVTPKYYRKLFLASYEIGE